MNRYRYVFLGLSITSSWGNGHATTYRALLRQLSARGHDVTFLERDLPFYRANRDMRSPPWARTHLYASVEELFDRWAGAIRDADLVVLGSYVPDGAAIAAWILALSRARAAFYDIDTPVTLASLARGDCAYVAPEQLSRFALYMSFTGGPTLDALRRRFGVAMPRALYCSVDPELYRPEPVETAYDLGYLGTYGADRQPALERLLLEPARAWPRGRFVVAGPQYPDDVAWPENVARVVHLAPREHRAFYCSQRFTLNVTRAAMTKAGWSPSVRIFEAAACGTPIVSDRWPGLEAILVPGREILVADTTAEALRFLRDTSEHDRRAIADAARARILAEHTSTHRAEAVERWTREVLERTTKRARFEGAQP